MTVDILQVTYGADFEWTELSLRSIRKFVSGFRDIVVCCPKNVDGIARLTAEHGARLMLFDHRDPGHMQQQFIKLTADSWLDKGHEHVVYLDADCIFYRPVDLQHELFRDKKPVLISADWSQDGTERWRTGSEALVGFSLPFNTMARHPSIYKTAHVEELRRHLEIRHHLPLEMICLQAWDQGITWFPSREGGKRWQPIGVPRFSEFCVLGGYCLERHLSEYWHINVQRDGGYPPPLIKQYWSHWDVTPFLRREIEQILH